MKYLIYLIIAFLLQVNAFTQECCDMALQKERQTLSKSKVKLKGKITPRKGVVKIPIVFHNLHKCDESRIQINQAADALKQVNERLKGFEFYLATQDKHGNFVSGFLYHEWIAGKDRNDMIRIASEAYPRNEYLNVWVVPQLTGASGYAFYPDDVHDEDVAYKDGIVQVHNYLSAATGTAANGGNNGRLNILAHEVGHWLNLQHAWGDEDEDTYRNVGDEGNCNYDDGVNDTPNCIGSTRIIYRPTDDDKRRSSCDEDDLADITNLMDYGAETTVTDGQYERMRMALGSPIAQRNEIGYKTFSNPISKMVLSKNYLYGKSDKIDVYLESFCGGGFESKIQERDYKIEGINKRDVYVEVVSENHIIINTLTDTSVNAFTIEFLDSAFKNLTPETTTLHLKHYKTDKQELKQHVYTEGGEPLKVRYSHFKQLHFKLDILGYLGIVVDREERDGFLLYSESSDLVQVATNLGTKDITYFPFGVSPNPFVYSSLTSGLRGETPIFNPNDWEGKDGYVYIRYKSGCESDWFYATVRFSMKSLVMYCYSSTYYNKPNLNISTGETKTCLPNIIRSDIRKITSIRFDKDVIKETDEGGLIDYSSTDTINIVRGKKYDLRFKQSSRNVTYWSMIIDLNNDGTFDEGTETVFNSETTTSGEYNRTMNVKDVLILPEDKNALELNTKVLILNNPRKKSICADEWNDGGAHIYNINIKNR